MNSSRAIATIGPPPTRFAQPRTRAGVVLSKFYCLRRHQGCRSGRPRWGYILSPTFQGAAYSVVSRTHPLKRPWMVVRSLSGPVTHRQHTPAPDIPPEALDGELVCRICAVPAALSTLQDSTSNRRAPLICTRSSLWKSLSHNRTSRLPSSQRHTQREAMPCRCRHAIQQLIESVPHGQFDSSQVYSGRRPGEGPFQHPGHLKLSPMSTRSSLLSLPVRVVSIVVHMHTISGTSCVLPPGSSSVTRRELHRRK
ncbi:hypothetical protein L226DRAFT_17412 [Lentinus tigrinus ALCF2SS1-7]|uniref:uncharacterized protein n=1 Tax=Lentinus tigrinus ALCF2SS1-7 TaxID=1328758 RepID=UPI001165F303|nr:hypothetical protein L226DRAFT_17412 [Lentinus tigrinus ALCF2SS1-7]